MFIIYRKYFSCPWKIRRKTLKITNLQKDTTSKIKITFYSSLLKIFSLFLLKKEIWYGEGFSFFSLIYWGNKKWNWNGIRFFIMLLVVAKSVKRYKNILYWHFSDYCSISFLCYIVFAKNTCSLIVFANKSNVSYSETLDNQGWYTIITRTDKKQIKFVQNYFS